jgi:hypothetical protein
MKYKQMYFEGMQPLENEQHSAETNQHRNLTFSSEPGTSGKNNRKCTTQNNHPVDSDLQNEFIKKTQRKD